MMTRENVMETIPGPTVIRKGTLGEVCLGMAGSVWVLDLLKTGGPEFQGNSPKFTGSKPRSWWGTELAEPQVCEVVLSGLL